MSEIGSISLPEFAQKLAGDDKICVLDVRTHAEVSNEFLENSVCLPLQDLSLASFAEAISHIPDGDTVYILCGSGVRAKKAAELLVAGVDRPLVVIEGGINAVKQAGIPVQKGGGKVMSLERQVRIAAGSLVFVGVVLGAFVHPGFYGVSAFVGAGLVFAGVTDTCAMGMMIARMPWNKA